MQNFLKKIKLQNQQLSLNFAYKSSAMCLLHNKSSITKIKKHLKPRFEKLEEYEGDKRIKMHSHEFYNNYVSVLALRLKLRSFLQTKRFNITNINITEPIKNSSKKSIKLIAQSA
jgi:hypothetical protein